MCYLLPNWCSIVDDCYQLPSQDINDIKNYEESFLCLIKYFQAENEESILSSLDLYDASDRI